MSLHESKMYMSRKKEGEKLRVKVSKTHDTYAFLEIRFKLILDITC